MSEKSKSPRFLHLGLSILKLFLILYTFDVKLINNLSVYIKTLIEMICFVLGS